MKKLVIVFGLLFSSCVSYNQTALQSTMIGFHGTVVGVDPKMGYVVVNWPCSDPPYKLQPCYGISHHPTYLFKILPSIGDTLTIK